MKTPWDGGTDRFGAALNSRALSIGESYRGGTVDSGEETEALDDQVRKVFRPSSPVTSPEFLLGRIEKLSTVDASLKIPGRSVFVYGERGVGKTSLALTGAWLFNSSKTIPVAVACHPAMTFSKLITLVARRLMRSPVYQTSKTKKSFEVGIDTHILKMLAKVESEEGDLPADIDLNDAVDLLNQITPVGTNTVVVVDEVDTIETEDVKRSLAYFVKQLGDRGCKTKFIFVGIADDVNELLVHHESASRYMATVKLDRLPINVLKEILIKGFGQINAKIWDELAMRIAMISDGFAHFTHLVGLKLALHVINRTDEDMPLEVKPGDLPVAIDEAIQDSEAWMKQAYDLAVQKYKDRYEPVLWAAADHWELHRSTEHMFASYQRICADLKKEQNPALQPLSRHQFSVALATLKRPSHGQALSSNRLSWYKFRKTMLRGYCRLVAESKHIKIGKDYQVPSTGSGASKPPEPEVEPTTEEIEQFEAEDASPKD